MLASSTPMEHQPHTMDMGSSPRTAAADLIRSIDNAFAEVNSLSVDAAREAEEARRNARIASELARRYRSTGSSPRDRDGDVITFHPGSGHFFLDSHLEDNGPGQYSPHHTNNNGRGGNVKPTPTPTPTPESEFGGLGKRNNGTASADDHYTKSHAEDALSVSLELERVKRSLESEEMAHDETKSVLAQARAKNAQLESQLERMENDMETQREDNGRTIDAMEHDLDRARERVDLAEEDAQLALDLAKSNAESREQLEEWLGKALEELEVLREQVRIVDTPDASSISHEKSSTATKAKHAVRFADSPTFFSESTPTRSPNDSPANRQARSMVSAGRKLLQRSLGAGIDDDSVHSVSVSPSKSAERRRRFGDRLKTAEEQMGNQKPSFLDQTGFTKDQNGQASPSKTMEASRNAARILKQSGERLNLSGRWWRETSDGAYDGAHLETLTRHYCTSVEVQLDHKRKEVVELESLCALWEQGSKNDSDKATGTSPLQR